MKRMKNEVLAEMLSVRSIDMLMNEVLPQVPPVTSTNIPTNGAWLKFYV